MTFLGANAEPRVAGHDELPGKANYLTGNDPAKWLANLPTYAKVLYEDIYPRIDLIYYGNQRQLEYDLVVRPGAAPERIVLGFAGADRVEVDREGDLVLHTADGGVIRQRKPVIYQEVAGRRRSVAGGYVLKGRHRVGFQVAEYDREQPLIIDPVLAYSSYLGGNNDGGYAIAADAAGNAYVTGAASLNLPTTPGAFQTTPGGLLDAFVTKLNPSGSGLVYSTFFGGSKTDEGFGIAVDAAGNAYVTGATGSTNFPTTPGAFQTAFGGGVSVVGDSFVTKLNPSGSGLVYSTFLGGSDTDLGFGIAVDAGGNAYVTGATFSTNFPTTPGAFQTTSGGGIGIVGDSFVTKLNPSGSGLVYSTYLGGSGVDEGRGIAVDTAGNAYVAGLTTSTTFPTTPGAFQATFGGAFVTKFNPNGSGLVYSTYLGGGADQSHGIAVDAAGNAYVTGWTSDINFPITPGAFQTTFDYPNNVTFVTKLNPSGSGLVYSTYLGGTGSDFGFGIAVDAGGNAYVTGTTFSTNFPTTPGAFQTTSGGQLDGFVTKLNSSGSGLVYSTYLGGSGNDEGQGIAVDASGNAYVTGFAGSTNFPTTPGAFQTTTTGVVVAFVAKIIADCAPTKAWTATGSMAAGRMAHTATRLPNGKVLVAGGRDSANTLDPVASAVLYDPASGAFASTGSMATARHAHTATLLPNGKVLIAGGVTTGAVCLASAELYDPAANNAAGAFTSAGSTNMLRADYTATLLPNGKILMAGGSCSGGSSAELYDPAANSGNGGSVATGSLAAIRVGHTATLLLAGGKVLIAGGMDTIQGVVLASAEIFDLAANNGAGGFLVTGSMASARQSHRAALLPSGGVLVTGGLGPTVNALASAEVFAPAAGTFTNTTPMATERSLHTATSLPNGKVLIAGGVRGAGLSAEFLASAELFDPAASGGAGAFAPTATMGTARFSHSANLLLDGSVLVAGGQGDASVTLASAELYATTCVPFNTPTGSNVVVQPVDTTTGQTPVTLTFSNVIQPGTTSLTTSSTGPAPPTTFDIGSGTYYHLTTTASFSGSVTVCIDYSGTALAGTTTQPTFGHYDDATMTWLTETVTFWDQANNIICADVSSFSPFALLVAANQPPVASAGADQTIECGRRVLLDGSGSFDPDGDPLTFEWANDSGQVVGTTSMVRLALKPGTHAFTLTVRDGNGGSAADEVAINVRDTRPPKLRLWLSPTVLWPPNHRLVEVAATVRMRDACDVSPTVTLESIVSNEPDDTGGPGDKANDIQSASLGTDDRSFLLRAERTGNGGDRIYTVTYRARDAAGNETTASAHVRVPHDRRRRERASEQANGR